MRMVVDANILLSAILGSSTRLKSVADRGIELIVADAQLFEAVKVLTRKIGFEMEAAKRAVEDLVGLMIVLEGESLGFAEDEARERLAKHGQPDWPVLAAAMALDGHIWTRDRDFFGVGVPVWSTRNIHLASAT